jgi:Mn2+/Fe2+ NRAMP family transporter
MPFPRPWVGTGGLERKATDARGFYGVIAVSVLAGLVIQYSPISPMKALFWSAVINGVVAVPLIVVIIVLVSKKSVMGAFTASRSLIILGWIATAVMGGGGSADVHPRLGRPIHSRRSDNHEKPA